MLANLLIRVPVILIALSIHEWAHAWAAHRYGDNTAKNEGRLTWNPLAHIDWFGLVPIVLGLPLGWAKPVPVNPFKLDNPSVALPVIAAAGPISNLIQFTVGCLVWWAISFFPSLAFHPLASYLPLLVLAYIQINWVLAFFNLFPIFPLDGGKVVSLLMPESVAARYEETFYRMGYAPLLILLVVDIAAQGAILRFWFSLWSPLGQPLLNLCGVPLDFRAMF